MNSTLASPQVSRHELLDLVEHYRVLVEHSSDVVVRSTTQGTIAWISPAVSGLLGWSPHELEGRAVLDLIHVDDAPAILRAQKQLNEGRPVDLTARLLTRDCGYRWIRTRVNPILDDEGTPVGRVACWHGIANEREGLDESPLPDQSFVLHTNDGVITWISAPIEHSIGWTREELIGKPSRVFVHPDDQHLMVTMREQRRSETPYAVRVRLVCKDGSFRWHDVASTLISSHDQGEWAVNVLRDVTDRVLAEQRRDQVEHRLAATLNALSEPHLHVRPVCDEQGDITAFEVVSANPAACAALQLAGEELMGRSLSGLLPETLVREICGQAQQVVTSGTPFVMDDLHLDNDQLGEHGLYDVRLALADDLLSLTFREVSERHLRYDAEARIRALEVLSAERERVARDLHDGAIQKVFATSLRLAALAAQLPESSRPRLEELIDLQDAVIKDLRTTVYQLGTTGWSSGSPSLAMTKAAREASRMLGFAPEVSVDDRIATIQDTAFDHVLFVLREALSNVARHAQAHEVQVSLTLDGSDLVLAVWDDGVGLDPHAPRGDGLGNMERRAQLLGGSCSITSRPGVGTELVWRVPAPPDPDLSGTQQRVQR